MRTTNPAFTAPPTETTRPDLQGTSVICLGFNLFGDALRDALDPTASDRK